MLARIDAARAHPSPGIPHEEILRAFALDEGTRSRDSYCRAGIRFSRQCARPGRQRHGPAKAALIDLDRRVQRFVPDLAIEVASESDIRRPTGEERALFEIGSSRGLAVLAAHPGSRYLRR